VSRPSPKELGLVCVEFQSVGGHPPADVNNAVCRLSGCRGGVLAVTMQVQLRVIREGMEGDTVSAQNVCKIGHIYYEQQLLYELATKSRLETYTGAYSALSWKMSVEQLSSS